MAIEERQDPEGGRYFHDTETGNSARSREALERNLAQDVEGAAPGLATAWVQGTAVGFIPAPSLASSLPVTTHPSLRPPNRESATNFVTNGTSTSWALELQGEPSPPSTVERDEKATSDGGRAPTGKRRMSATKKPPTSGSADNLTSPKTKKMVPREQLKVRRVPSPKSFFLLPEDLVPCQPIYDVSQSIRQGNSFDNQRSKNAPKGRKPSISMTPQVMESFPPSPVAPSFSSTATDDFFAFAKICNLCVCLIRRRTERHSRGAYVNRPFKNEPTDEGQLPVIRL